MNLLLAALMSWAFLTRGNFPPVNVDLRELRHPVVTEDIQRHLRPSWHPRAPGSGRTHSEIEVRARLEPDTAGCTVAALQVDLLIRTYLPEPVISSPVPARLARQWRESVRILELHEQGHRLHALESARRLREQLLQLGARRNCMHLQLAINRLQQRELQRLDDRDDRYDQRTAHGTRESRPPPESTRESRALARKEAEGWRRMP